MFKKTLYVSFSLMIFQLLPSNVLPSFSQSYQSEKDRLTFSGMISNADIQRIDQVKEGSAPPKEWITIWNKFNAKHDYKWKVVWDKEIGAPTRFFGYRTEPKIGPPRTIAEQFLMKNSDLFMLEDALNNVRFEEVMESSGAFHVRFSQTYKGYPVFGAGISVHINKAGQITLIQNNRFPNISLEAVENIPEQRAVQISREELRLPNDYVVSTIAEKQIIYLDNEYTLVWSIILASEQDAFCEYIIIDIANGDVVKRGTLITNASATGLLFDPNPNIASGDLDLEPHDSTVDNWRTQRTLRDMVNEFSLVGTYARVHNDLGPEAIETDGTFDYPHLDQHFGEVMSYYHITEYRHYLSTISAPFSAFNQINVHVNDDCTDLFGRFIGSYYHPIFNSIHLFGQRNPYDQWVDDAEDADVLIHEFGHAIQNSIRNSMFRWGHEAKALNEGTSDYLACSYYKDPNLGEWFANSRNYFNNYIRRLENNRHYPEHLGDPKQDKDGYYYESSLIWSGALWDVRASIDDRDISDRLVLEGIYNYPWDPWDTFFDGAVGILQADDDLYGGMHMNMIQQVFVDRGIMDLNLEIENPTQTAPTYAGVYNDPNQIDVWIKMEYPFNNSFVSGFDNSSDYDVKIDGITANVLTVFANEDHNRYELKVLPPSMNQPGTYDLDVTVAYQSLTEYNAVEFGTTNIVNVDVIPVIDRSGSMGDGFYEPGVYYLREARNAASLFVDQTQDGDQIGVVSFSTDASVDFPLTLVTSDYIRNQAKTAINGLTAYGATSIGDGLQSAQNQFLAYGRGSMNWAMILMSDGEENESLMVADVLPDIVPTKTTVYTIAFGIYSDENLLQDIANQTNGAFFYLPNPQASDLLNIYNMIKGAATGQGQTIYTWQGELSSGQTDYVVRPIDSFIEQAIFQITWVDPYLDLDLLLEAPDGTTIDETYANSDPNVTYYEADTYKGYTVNDPQNGDWEMQISSPLYAKGLNPKISTSGYPYSGSITAPLSDLLLSTELNAETYATGNPIKVLASLSDNIGAITGAEINVLVESPNSLSQSLIGRSREMEINIGSYDSDLNTQLHSASDSSWLQLYDDGQHDDGLAEDGIYAGYFYETDYPGSYNFTLTVKGYSNNNDLFNRESKLSAYIEESSGLQISGYIYSNPETHTGIEGIEVALSGPTAHDSKIQPKKSSGSKKTKVMSNEIIDYTYTNAEGYYSFGNLNYGGSYVVEPEKNIGFVFSPDSIAIFPLLENADSVNFHAATPDYTPSTGGSLSNDNVYAYPNPFNPEFERVVFRFSLSKSGDVTINIYDAIGKLIKTLEQGTLGEEMEHYAPWDGKNENGEMTSNGIYFYVIKSSSGERAVGKIAILR